MSNLCYQLSSLLDLVMQWCGCGVRGYVLGRRSSLNETSKSPILHITGWKERSEKSQMKREAFNNGPPIVLGGHPETLTWKQWGWFLFTLHSWTVSILILVLSMLYIGNHVNEMQSSETWFDGDILHIQKIGGMKEKLFYVIEIWGCFLWQHSSTYPDWYRNFYIILLFTYFYMVNKNHVFIFTVTHSTS